MNANQIINMVVRMVFNRVVRTGLNAGINAVGDKMSKGKTPDQAGKAPDSSETTKRMRQTMRVTRKIGRF